MSAVMPYMCNNWQIRGVVNRVAAMPKMPKRRQVGRGDMGHTNVGDGYIILGRASTSGNGSGNGTC